jgi:hypothetical protein
LKPLMSSSSSVSENPFTKSWKLTNAAFITGSLILIPGLGTLPVEQWGLLELDWWGQEGTLNTKVRLVTYDYEIPLDRAFTWEIFLYEGEKLLEALTEDRMGQKVGLIRSGFSVRNLESSDRRDLEERKSPIDVHLS